MTDTDTIPVSADNPVSTGLSLHYFGKHASAYNYAASQAAGTWSALDFKTGNEYIIGYFTAGQDNKVGSEHEFRILINGVTAFESKNDNGTQVTAYAPFTAPLYFLIPPHTRLQVEIDTNGTTNLAVTFAGRVYGEK
tara:strand:- start:72 stop:482 length:411 start_codon:yes stop_codon:yes gene_type:complete